MRRVVKWMWKAVLSAGWAPVLVFAVHVVLSRGFDAYLAVPEIDIPMHLVGGVAIAFFLRRALVIGEADGLLGRLSELGRSLFTLASVCAAAVVWEFAEWVSDRLGFSRAQLGLEDTLFDMSLGIAGGLAFLLVSRYCSSRVVAATAEPEEPAPR